MNGETDRQKDDLVNVNLPSTSSTLHYVEVEYRNEWDSALYFKMLKNQIERYVPKGLKLRQRKKKGYFKKVSKVLLGGYNGKSEPNWEHKSRHYKGDGSDPLIKVL